MASHARVPAHRRRRRRRRRVRLLARALPRKRGLPLLLYIRKLLGRQSHRRGHCSRWCGSSWWQLRQRQRQPTSTAAKNRKLRALLAHERVRPTVVSAPHSCAVLAFPYLSRYTFRYLPLFFCKTITIYRRYLPEKLGSSRR